jgi:CHAT domain-containing protein
MPGWRSCLLARPGGRLADEVIHLASAFQFAGYRHVIATLWPIGDWPAATFAADVYNILCKTGEDGAAKAVHAAVRRIRRRSDLIGGGHRYVPPTSASAPDPRRHY